MGHSSASMTLDIYTHVDSDNVRETIKKLTASNPDAKIDTKSEKTGKNL